MLEWFIIGGMAIALYVILYKYEKKMEKMQELIDANKERIDKNHTKIKDHHSKIGDTHERLDEHYNHLEKLWISSPKHQHVHEDKKNLDSKD